MGACSASSMPHLPSSSSPQVEELRPQKQEKLREVHGLQRPSGVVLSKGSTSAFEAKSEQAAERRRMAERQERLLLKAQGQPEAGPKVEQEAPGMRAYASEWGI